MSARAVSCPRCENPLRAGTYSDHAVHHCKSCLGTFYDQPALGKSIERMSADLFSKIDPALPIAGVKDKGDGLSCPLCSSAMEHYGYMGAHRIMLDRCESCDKVWVDALELAAMAQMHVRLSKNMKTFQESYSPADVVGMTMTLKAVESWFLTRLVLS